MVKRERQNAAYMHGVVNEFSGFVVGSGTEKIIRDSLMEKGADHFISIDPYIFQMKDFDCGLRPFDFTGNLSNFRDCCGFGVRLR